MGKRERAIRAEQTEAPSMNVNLGTTQLDEPAGDFPVPGFAEEPEGVRPPNADRVLAQLRDLLGPLITALDVETAAESEPAVPAPRAPEAPRAHQERASGDLVAVCADGVISYDAEEAW
jgi:hypothetical protein